MKSKKAQTGNKLTQKNTDVMEAVIEAAKQFNALNDTDGNALLMAELVPELVNIIEKISMGDVRLQERVEKLTKENNELKTQNKILKDGTDKLLRERSVTNRKKNTIQHQHYLEKYHPDARRL